MIRINPAPVDSIPLGGLKNGITPIDASRAWIGGVRYEPGRIYLYQTADGGRTWTPSPVTTPAEYAEAELQTPGPSFVDPEVAFLPVHISHQYGVMLAVYASHDGGASWMLTPQYIPQGGSIDFVSREVGFAWNGHNFYRTGDGAQSWDAITPDVDFTDSFAGMDFVSPHGGLRVERSGRQRSARVRDARCRRHLGHRHTRSRPHLARLHTFFGGQSICRRLGPPCSSLTNHQCSC